ncbi:hypothetical protein PG993_011356 [Apiospora rasikravindrae]|uniref:F-box domain-containing protein n=1 Tax=Apiospora rasikravindrae TaxID=990691 RepID=A0ABR1SDZ1_9PEZI
MLGLLTIPPELLLMIQGYLLTREDRLALSGTCQALNRMFGGKCFYEQDAAEERDFDQARLQLEDINRSHVHGELVFQMKDFAMDWSEAMYARFAKAEAMVAVFASGEEKTAREEELKDIIMFIKNCVGRWGPLMLSLTNPVLQGAMLKFGVNARGGSLRSQTRNEGPTVTQRALKYPASIHGAKSEYLDRMADGTPDVDCPVHLACRYNRVDVLDLLHEKGVDINVVQGRFQSDAWTWMRMFPCYEKDNGNLGMPEDVCVWLVEHNLGFTASPDSLNLDDLKGAAVQNRPRLVAALVKHFESKLNPDEYREALGMALRASTAGMPEDERLPGRWPRPNRGNHGVLAEQHHAVIDILLRAGASVRQDPGRVEDKGLLANAVAWSSSVAIRLLQRQLAEGVTDHRDVRAALFVALERHSSRCWRRCPVGLCSHSGRGEQAREFFAMILPSRARLACDPFEIATPEGCENAFYELWDQFISHIESKCLLPNYYDTALYIEELMRSHMSEERRSKRITPWLADLRQTVLWRGSKGREIFWCDESLRSGMGDMNDSLNHRLGLIFAGSKIGN